MKQENRKNGIILIAVLILSLTLVLLSLTGIYLSKSGYISLSSEAKYEIAEKKANSILVNVIKYIARSRECNYPYTLPSNYELHLKPDNTKKSCLVWVKVNYKGAKVVKVAVVPLNFPLWSTVILRKLTYFNLQGNSAIISCEPRECKIPALITGNTVENATEKESIITNCPAEFLSSGVLAKVDPYIPDAFNASSVDITSWIFDSANRTELLKKLENTYGVNLLSNNGAPSGLVHPDGIFNFSSCKVTSLYTITCDDSVSFTWDNTTQTYISGTNKYSALDLGDATLLFGYHGGPWTEFYGGGKISAKDIIIYHRTQISSADSKNSPLILVAKNSLTFKLCGCMHNIPTLKNVYIFANAMDISGMGCCGNPHSADKIKMEGGLLYVHKDLELNLTNHSYIGTEEDPTLIIADGNALIGKAGNSEIHGLLFITNSNATLKLGEFSPIYTHGHGHGGHWGAGRFLFEGMIVSNSLDNQIKASGNFEIRFNREIIKKLKEKINFIKVPYCGSYFDYLILNTKAVIY